MSKKEILIVGGAGYIGNSLINILDKSLYRVIVVDNFCVTTKYKREQNKKLLSEGKIDTLIEANVSEIDQYIDEIKNVEIIFYLASMNSSSESKHDPEKYIRENVVNMGRFYNTISGKLKKIKKLILTSSRAVYGEMIGRNGSVETDMPCPISVYGMTKYAQETLSHKFSVNNNITLDIFRIFNVFGENQGKYYNHIGVIPMLHASILDNNEVDLYGNGEIIRDYVYISDIVSILKKSMEYSEIDSSNSQVYNIGTGKGISLLTICRIFKESMEDDFRINLIDTLNDVKISVANTEKLISDFGSMNFLPVKNFIKKRYLNDR